MNALGFRLNRKEDTFERNRPQGQQILSFIITQAGLNVNVEPWWGIRIDSIIEIYHKITEKDQDAFEWTQVFENNLAKLIDYIDNNNETPRTDSPKYLVKSMDEVESLIRTLPVLVEKYVLPYFDANSTVERANILLNSNLRKQVVHNWIYPFRAMMGLIAAKLAHNPDYGQILSVYQEELAEASDSAKNEFEKLKVLLA